ncbi:outer membrane beta-barrel protein [Hymenobacter sp. H14-R3]|uniref:outer membrane beta-barrel protein n=1 Tax=Hymenobacter sp. H14-R3 TaxID=3046308 RepID=UPI0024B9EB26|nr:outer membrane beta-barrel protein [Hymenobacter sp. H14-R3]MDJ0364622.1 outer membrane beta-barrel protein [Hymenobacter sp. H14-R3]
MTAFRLACCALLVGSPLLGRAQTTAALPRYYVGLAAYSSDFQPLGGTYYGGTTVPVQLTLGYQLQPRLAVQLGVAYSQKTYDYVNTSQSFYSGAAPGLPYYFAYSSHGSDYQTSVRGLVRYTLTRQPAHRVQFDVLGGLTFEYARANSHITRTDSDSLQNVIVTTNYDDHYSFTNFLLTGGLSTRYRFSQRLEAVLDVTLSRSFMRGQNSGFPGSTALGLRYRFGQR